MEVLTLVLLVAIVALLGYLLWERRTPQDSQSMLMLQQHIQELERSLEAKLGEGTNRMFEGMRLQTDQSQKTISTIQQQLDAITDRVSQQLNEVVRGVSETRESTKQVFTLAGQLQNLEKILTHQKQRGNLGEASLELILSNILPPGSYKMQHEFPGGETVDAIINTKEGMIPIDAKFSLDNYTRLINAVDEKQREELERQFKNDLKTRIDECSKYVRPKDGTLPFAFMYIPAEAIYYDLLINEVGSVKVNTRNLIDYAYNEKKVIIVSPTTFAAYLQSVLYGFKAFKIEETAKDIAKNVESLSRHLKAYEEYYSKLGNSLSTTVNHFNAGRKELGKIDKDVLKITGVSPELETSLLERPISAND
ncbi:MAG: DNA recombination protein RmuC [Candidatus Pacebacteria bacterium]|nr:DNA recombination protein RmuC [Candidatus Paceibacterota bacterium]